MSTISADITCATAHTAPARGASLAATMRSWLGSLRAVAALATNHAEGDQVGEGHKQSVAVRIRERLRRSAHDKQPMTVVVFELGDLPLVERVFGASMAREVLAHVTGKLQRRAGRSGLAVRTAPYEFTVLLPWADSERAVDTVHAVFGKPCRVEFEMDHAEILLLPHLEVSTLECDAASIDATYQKLRHQIAQARLHDVERHAHDLDPMSEMDSELQGSDKTARAENAIDAPDCFAATHLEAAATQPAPLDLTLPLARDMCYTPAPATIPMPIGLH
jgi:GGDEF domain-containing protein